MHQYDSDVLIGVDRVMSRDSSCIPDVIKQESHLAGKTCLEPLTAAANGYCLSNGARDNWPAFRDGFSFTSAPDPKMVANMASVSSTSGQLGQFTSVDWTTMGARTQASTGNYYSPPLAHAQTAYGGPAPHHHPHHHPYGWTDATHGHAQSAYAYGMTSPHTTYRQSDSSPTSYPYSSFGGATSLQAGSGVKDGLVSTPSIQDMDAERTIRRARRNRTCFSKHQMESLEEVFKESRYPDVYRREEIAATLDLKEEVVRVWFKNRRAKLKRENKDGKVTSPGSPTSTTPSPKSTTSPSFPTSTLYTSASYPTTASFSPLPLKADHVTGSAYFTSPYAGYAHSTVSADSASAHSPAASVLPKPQLAAPLVGGRGASGSNNNSSSSIADISVGGYSSRSDVTSTYNSVKCEPAPSEAREYKTTNSDLLSPTGSDRPTGSSTGTPSGGKTHHHHPLSPSEADH